MLVDLFPIVTVVVIPKFSYHHICCSYIQEEKRPPGRSRCRWVDNIKMDLEEIGWGSVYWTGVAQDRDKWRPHAKAVISLWVP
jgi:hypothetical protein